MKSICGGTTYKWGDDVYGCGAILTKKEVEACESMSIREHDRLCSICSAEKVGDDYEMPFDCDDSNQL